MYGKGIVKGLGVTLKQFVDTYLDEYRLVGTPLLQP